MADDEAGAATLSILSRLGGLQGKDGAQGRNRTTDTVIFSHVLYQLSYLGPSAKAEASAYKGAYRSLSSPSSPPWALGSPAGGPGTR